MIRFGCAFVGSSHSRFQIKRLRIKVEIELLYDDDDNDESIKSVSVVWSCGIRLSVNAHNIDSACTQLQATAHDFPFIIFKHNVEAIKPILNTSLFFNSHKLVTHSIYVELFMRRAFRIFFSLPPEDISTLLNVLLPDLFSMRWRFEPVYMFAFVPLIWIQLHLPALQMLSSTSSLISWSNFSALLCKHFAGSGEGNFHIV